MRDATETASATEPAGEVTRDAGSPDVTRAPDARGAALGRRAALRGGLATMVRGARALGGATPAMTTPGAGAAGAAAFWGGATLTSARASASPAVTADVDPGALVRRLVSRVTFGATREELNLALSLGFSGYLEYQLNHLAIDDSACDARLAPFTTLGMIPQQLYALSDGQVRAELVDACILRAVYSRRQLFERMVELWTDHFNIDHLNGDDRYLKTVDDRDVVRANALGSFPTLLRASAQSPAMLLYLDNNVSTALAPNENYSRELMELHTLSVNGGYTQQDVKEVARCFTGWTLFGRNSGASSGLFRYNAANHDNNAKVVLGNAIAAGGGINDGFRVLDILLAHPKCAEFIATKMCRRFLGENVPTSVVAGVAAVFTSTGGDIKAMLRAILTPNNLATDFGPRYKRPFHLLASALRSAGANVTNAASLRTRLVQCGHMPFLWSSPDGYPDTLEYWSGLMLPRWNVGASLASASVSGTTIDFNAFFSGATTAAQMADRLDERLFNGEMPAPEKDRVRQHLLPDPPSTTRRNDAFGLAAAAPAFQYY